MSMWLRSLHFTGISVAYYGYHGPDALLERRSCAYRANAIFRVSCDYSNCARTPWYDVLQHDFDIYITCASVPPSYTLSSLLLLPQVPEASEIYDDLSQYSCFIPRSRQRCRLVQPHTAYRANARRAFDSLNPICAKPQVQHSGPITFLT